jgi:hypothetical protein
MEFLIILWVLCGVFSAIVAFNKNHNGCMWGVAGVLFGPLALLAVGFMPASEAPGQQRIKCPHCAELILVDAKLCRFCGQTLTPSQQATISSAISKNQTQEFRSNMVIGATVSLIVVLLLFYFVTI